MRHNNILDKAATMSMINVDTAEDAIVYKYDGSGVSEISDSVN